MAVRSENHLSAARLRFAHILVNDRLMYRYANAPEPLRSRQAEQMVILIEGTRHSAEAVMTIRHDKREGERFDPTCDRRLQHADISHIVCSERIEAQRKPSLLFGAIVRRKDTIRHSTLSGTCAIDSLRLARGSRYQPSAIEEVHAIVILLNHSTLPMIGLAYRSMDTPGC